MAKKIRIKVTSKHRYVKEDYLVIVEPGTYLHCEVENTQDFTKEELSNIHWVAHTISGYPSFTTQHFHEAIKGAKCKVKVSKVFAGGGLAWIEPVLDGSKPKNIPPSGFFVNAYEAPSIVKIEWREYQKDNLGAIITGEKCFSEAVQLHVYTTGMYGENVAVKLKDYKCINYELDSHNKEEEAKIKEANKKRAEKEKQEETVYFYEMTREIKTYKHAEDPEKIVQKAIFNIHIESRWIYAGKELEIAPEITLLGRQKYEPKVFKNYLKVRQKKAGETPVSPLQKQGNKPVIVGTIPTDTAEFKPCFFTEIKAIYNKGDEPTEAELYNSKKGIKPKIMSFAAVAGPRHARREVTLVLDTDTKKCFYENNENLHHKDKVIDLSAIPEAIVVASSIKDKGYRLTNKDNIQVGGLTFEQEDGDHGDNNDNGEMNEDNVFNNLSLDTVISVGKTTKKAWNKPQKTYSKQAGSDTKVTIEVPYKYGKTTNSEKLKDVLKHIWPASAKNKQTYPIKLHTCRQTEAIVNIDVYPDIKWTLQFCYNTDPQKFKEITEKYQEYKVRVEELEKEAQDTFDDKIKRNEELAETYDQLADEIKVNKKKINKKIARYEKSLQKVDTKKQKIELKNKLAEAKEHRKKLTKQQEKYRKNKEKYQQKAEKNKEKKAKYEKKGKKKLKKDESLTHKNTKPFKFKDNLGKGVSDIVLSLWAEWDYPAEKFEVTAGYQKYVEIVKTILKYRAIVADIFDGKKKGNIEKHQKKNTSKKPSLFDDGMQEKLAKILAKMKPKKLVSFNVVPPSIALAGSWYAENPKGEKQYEIGTNLELTAILDPFIGAEIALNFMALVQRSHPVVAAAVAMMDLGGFEIRLDLTVTGSLFAKGMIQYNTTSGKSNITPGDIKQLQDAEDDAPLEIGGRVEMEVYAGIKYTKKYEAWRYKSVVEFNAFASMVTGLTLSGFVEWVKDNPAYSDGVYLNPKLTFHGLTVKVAAKGSGRIKDRNSEESLVEINKTIGAEFVIMDPYEAVLDVKIPLF